VTRPTDAGGLGFGFKWNMGWMHDTLVYVQKEPFHRQYHHNDMTFAAVYAWSENFVLPISHDEVVHGKRSLAGKMPGDFWQRMATVRALLGFMWGFPGKQLLFMGSEFADEREWSEERGLDWALRHDPMHGGVQRALGDLNRAYSAHPALWTRDTTPEGFRWLVATTRPTTCSRSGGSARTVRRSSWWRTSPPYREGYRLGMPKPGVWREIINDAELYGGSGVGNLGEVHADHGPWHGQPHSSTLRIPPLATLWLTPKRAPHGPRS
jgi:1,4-alpha-glucan branching enzyme